MRKILQKILIWIFPELYQLKSPEYDFTKLRSWQENVKLGQNVKINPVSLIVDSEIGDYSYISTNSTIFNTTIGKFCSIGPNFFCGWGIHPTNGISTSPMFYSNIKQNGITLSPLNKIEEREPIIIGNDVFIGANVTVLDGVTINDGAIIGAGAVVSKDIPPYAIAVGCPIKITKYRFDNNKINDLLEIKWWNFSDENLKDVEAFFFNVNKFIQKYVN
ncbi:MAG: CatB-related O-acetyltransferase [Paludibacteraceae bacterium]|nr:CatB-related O-acetyltransferase [Paludibacteraceae bacterium]